MLGKEKITVLFAKFNETKISLRLYLHVITHLSCMPGLEFIDTKFTLPVQSTRQPLTLIVLNIIETIFQIVRTCYAANNMENIVFSIPLHGNN